MVNHVESHHLKGYSGEGSFNVEEVFFSASTICLAG